MYKQPRLKIMEKLFNSRIKIQCQIKIVKNTKTKTRKIFVEILKIRCYVTYVLYT